MKILCTGGSGFLGKYIQQEVEVNDSELDKHMQKYSEEEKKEQEFISYDLDSGLDVCNKESFYNICKDKKTKPDIVVHAAAVADLYESDKNLDRNYAVNVTGTHNIGSVCSTFDIPLIYVSTCCAYGNASEDKPINELDVVSPTEAYAWSKYAGEKVLGCVGTINGYIVRLGTFYGPGMRDSLFNARVIIKALKDDVIEIHGDGTQSRQYIHVKDVARNIYTRCIEKYYMPEIWKDLAKQADSPLPVFNITGKVSISVNATLRTVSKILEKPIKVKYIDDRKGQIKKQDISSIVNANPVSISYEEGMRECIEWYKGKLNGSISD